MKASVHSTDSTAREQQSELKSLTCILYYEGVEDFFPGGTNQLTQPLCCLLMCCLRSSADAACTHHTQIQFGCRR